MASRRIISKKTDPPQEPGESVTIIGGKADNRPQAEWKPEDGIGWYGKRQCCHIRERSGGQRCGKLAKIGKDGCHRHAGGDGPPIKTGRYARSLPKRLISRFEDHALDEHLLDTRRDVALLGAAAEMLLEQGATFGDTPNFRRDAYRLFTKMRSAGNKGKAGAADFNEAMGELGALLRDGYDSARALVEGIKLVERRAFRAERAREVRVKEERVVTERDFLQFMQAVILAIRGNASQPDADRIIHAVEHSLPDAPAVPASAAEG